MKKRGISLIVLVITIVVIAILATTVILLLFNNNTIDQSKKAKFMSDYRTVQEGVNLFSLGKYNAATNEFELPLKGHLTAEDKTYIADNVPTLKTKIEELSGSIDTVDLAWISSENIGVKLSKEKSEKGYILDVANGLIYDYNGDFFEGQMWHTLDGGVVSGGPGVPGGTTVDELWNGWIKLTLYYPPNSTEKQWRLGTEGELRADPILMWQNYTGPITIPLDRVKDVWIKYKLDNKEVIIPPAGTLLVDIVPDKTGYTMVPGVKVHINFDETATVKEYRVGDSNWMPYTGEFNVTENCIIEARAKKTETIYNADGTVLTTRNIAGRDLVYIGNIGIEETDLEAPAIVRLPAVGTEKARVRVTYPANAANKIYKVNYGIEENYTTEINVQNYGTYIIAYYYDASGKRSKATGIRINDTSDGTPPDGPGPYDPLPPRDPDDPQPPTPQSTIPAPTVVVNPTGITEEVEVSIDAPANADNIYVKLGRYGDYELYTSSITVRENMDIYAYYRTNMGERSDTGYGRVSNIKKNNRPYVRIDADPYPYSWSYGASQVNVTINYSDATTIEYSKDGVVFIPYTSAFIVTENKTIYARAVNTYGITETSLNITNIGKIKPPTPIGNLSVGINVNPEPTVSTTRFAKVNITIDYDEKAIEKYYRIGTYGELKPYAGAFEVTSNCTIYAYAKGTNAIGNTSKRIDNLSDGIAELIIVAEPSGKEQSSKVSVTIEYDKYSTLKRYSINGGALRDYVGAFEVTKNGSVIYAYSENDVGQKAEARYTVNNIVPEPPVLLLDKGQYYILKLNYPSGSKNREYKWKENGEWKGYKEAGILLLKPQYKDQLIQNGTLVKIEDESGKLVTFTGDYYFIDVPISELFENLFMRWDREPLGAPQIVITPTEPAMEVTANIVYNTNLVKKQYKVVNPDGSIRTDWTDYTGAITIDRNNSIVYAKGMDDTEVWTVEAMKKVTNIDENPPVIKLTADLIAAQQKVAIKVSVTDDVGIGKVKWAAGVQGESYFTTAGTEIQNNSIVNITSNGYYTFYAEDQVGNLQVYTLNVTNVDLTAPAIDIQVSPETTVGLTVDVTISYGDSVTKQYKVGTANNTWINYTTTFSISSYTILANNWQNEDGTVTIYAKGKDSAGNEITVQKKIVSLDLDKPQVPVINSNAGYPRLNSYGVTYDATTTINYDSRTDIDNYYSIDNGLTWKTYNGSFDYPTGTIIAKSIKKDTNLEVSSSKTISMPTDAIGQQAYDGLSTTGFAAKLGEDSFHYMVIDKSALGKVIKLNAKGYAGAAYNINYYDENKVLIKNITGRQTDNITYTSTIPANAKYIGFSGGGSKKDNDFSVSALLIEIYIDTSATFTGTFVYPKITLSGIAVPYNLVKINYYETSVQRLYSLDNGITWKEYNDEILKVAINSTITTKGVDKNGNQTYISTYTSNVVSDVIGPQAYDGSNATGFAAKLGESVFHYIEIDPAMIGKIIKLYAKGYAGAAYNINYYNSNKSLIQSITGRQTATTTYTSTIPTNAKYIGFSGNGNKTDNDFSFSSLLIEMYIDTSATFTNTFVYPKITGAGIVGAYNLVKINYYDTCVQRLYSLDNGVTWKEYNDETLNVPVNSTISTKGIDKNGIQTPISTYTSNVVSDAIGPQAYDGSNTTGFAAKLGETSFHYIEIDSSAIGKTIKLYAKGYAGAAYIINYYNSSKGLIQNISGRKTTTTTYTSTIPTNAKYIGFSGGGNKVDNNFSTAALLIELSF